MYANKHMHPVVKPMHCGRLEGARKKNSVAGLSTSCQACGACHPWESYALDLWAVQQDWSHKVSFTSAQVLRHPLFDTLDFLVELHWKPCCISRCVRPFAYLSKHHGLLGLLTLHGHLGKLGD